MSKLVDEILKGMNPTSLVGGRKVDEPDRAMIVGGKCLGRVSDEPDRSTPLGSTWSACIPPSDSEPHEASWADLPREIAKNGLYGRRGKD
jgi:hypothetical protein